MTNADYYVNEYSNGRFSDKCRSRKVADGWAQIICSPAPWKAGPLPTRIGVWHVRLKEGKR